MSAPQIEPDRWQIESFADAIFRHVGAEGQGYISLRSFYENKDVKKPFRVTPVRLNGEGLKFLADTAVDDARRAAQFPERVVFCPPIAVFSTKEKARKEDIILAPALSVECDQSPYSAFDRLVKILGVPTLSIRSGGQWTAPDTGEVQDKLHLHWRLSKPAENGSLSSLEEARRLACSIVGGDPTNIPISHPIRWAGSWHRKGEPRLSEIEYLFPDREIELDWALMKLVAGEPAAAPGGKPNGAKQSSGNKWTRQDYERIIEEGAGEGEDRSRLFHRVIWHLAAQGLSADQITDKLARYPNGIAAKYADRLHAEVLRSYDKWRAERGVTLGDFRAYMPMHNYFYVPTRDPWPAGSVNACVPPVPLFDSDGNPVLKVVKGELVQDTIAASSWLDRNQRVEQMTWSPGDPLLIPDRLVSDGGWIGQPGVTCFNLYRPPVIRPGNAHKAGPWLDHFRKVFPDDAEHALMWLAHRVQKPQAKINHALVLGGPMGIGKDAALEPVKRAIGPWNFLEVSPQHLLGRFNGFVKSVILRISEARDLGDVDRYAFYDHMKAYTAAPPDVLRCDEKNLREHSVLNVCGVIITTNHKADGIFLPADDRRHFVAWSDLRKEDFPSDYWKRLWHYYDHGGAEHVAAYLAGLDISLFDSKAPPPKTSAFWEIVDASRAPEDAEMTDAIDALGHPSILTLADILLYASVEFGEWLRDRRNARRIPHRLEDCGYVAVRNDGSTDGRWKVNGQNRVIYGKKSITKYERVAACWRFTGAR